MKNLFYLNIVLAALLMVVSCTPPEFPEAVSEFNPKAQILGTWGITQVIQVDENARFRGFPERVTTKDITHALPEHPYTDFSITFNADETYSLSKGRSLITVPDNTGTWSFNSADAPSSIILEGANGKIQEMDITQISGLRFEESTNRTLGLGLVRYAGNRPFLSYRYQMDYQN